MKEGKLTAFDFEWADFLNSVIKAKSERTFQFHIYKHKIHWERKWENKW